MREAMDFVRKMEPRGLMVLMELSAELSDIQRASVARESDLLDRYLDSLEELVDGSINRSWKLARAAAQLKLKRLEKKHKELVVNIRRELSRKIAPISLKNSIKEDFE